MPDTGPNFKPMGRAAAMRGGHARGDGGWLNAPGDRHAWAARLAASIIKAIRPKLGSMKGMPRLWAFEAHIVNKQA
jgi:hypothetical protein